MIAFAVVDEIERLLGEGNLSQRKIAVRLGVSRGTVNAIAQGKRPDYRTRRRERDDDFIAPCGPVARCPTCGAKVAMPCLACRVRALRASRRPRRAERSAARRGPAAA